MTRPEQAPDLSSFEGTYRSGDRFTYRLRAAAYHGGDYGAVDAAARQALLAVLEELRHGDTLAVEVGRTDDAGEGGIEWSLSGRSLDSTPQGAKEAAGRLREIVSSAFRSVPEFDLTLDRFSGERRIRARPLSRAVVLLAADTAGHPIGFGGAPFSEKRGEDVVALPLPLNPTIDAPGLLMLVARLPVDTSLRFTLKQVLLNDTQRSVLERLLNSIQRGAPVGRRLDTGFHLGYQTLETLRSYWEPLLQGLLMRGSGCLLDVVALARRFSRGVERQLSTVAWPGFEIADAATRAVLPANALDLRSLAPAAWVASRLAPTCGDLGRLAFRAAFRAPLERPKAVGIRLGSAGRHPVALGDNERARHLYVLGATGTGKTTLLGNCVKQAIAAGEGIALLDPHGDLIADVLRWLPPRRARDVILFDPSDSNRAPGLNLLDGEGQGSRARNSIIANELVEIFRRLYRLNVSTGGPVFEQYVRNAILLLVDNDIRPPLTLCEVPLIFESSDFRATLIRRCSNPYVVAFWRDQAEKVTGDGALRNMGPWITSKMNQFTQNPLIRSIVGQSAATINFRKCMDEGKILLCDLTKGILGAYDVKLLGMLLTTKLLQAALSRTDIAPRDRKPYSLFIDEFQNFVSDSVAQGLSEARKFGLRIVLANQHLAQLERADPDAMMATAILGNAANLLLFRLGPSDASTLEAYTKPQLTAADLQFLPDFHVAARILRDGRPLRPFVIRTDPTIRPEHSEAEFQSVMQSIAVSRAEYTRLVDAIEQEIADRRAAIQASPKSVGSNTDTTPPQRDDCVRAA